MLLTSSTDAVTVRPPREVDTNECVFPRVAAAAPHKARERIALRILLDLYFGRYLV